MYQTTPVDDRHDLRSEIKHALNRACAENAFDAATHARSGWYGHHDQITAATSPAPTANGAS